MDFRTPAGTTCLPTGGVRFEVWAPDANSVQVLLVDIQQGHESQLESHSLTRDDDGIWSTTVPNAQAGTLYRYSINERDGRPDPRSRFQPHGVHGPSQVIDTAFQWTDANWLGVAKRDLVIYEMHVGSFTEAGTYRAAIERLDSLVELGITAIELLPLAQTPGQWNWGYDGVNYFAPRNTYGTPQDLQAFVNACHARSLAVFHDVVYNHVGPEGNYLSEFAPYRSPKRGTPWGDALNFDGKGCDHVRQFVIDNITYWIQDFHFDGVRLDAVHYMFDEREVHILDEIRDRFAQLADSLDRQIYLIGESNIYDPHLVGDLANENPHHDAIWSDCIMHSIYSIGDPDLRLTNRHYQPTDLATALEHGYVFCTPEAVRATPKIRQQNHIQTNGRNYLPSMITALQTHDSVGNHPHGKRLHQLTDLEFTKAALPLILLYPSIPMLFMGEEIASNSPFPFFADFEDEGLRKAVDKGRRDEYPHHAWDDSPLPSDPRAFTSSCLDEGHNDVWHWYRSLLELRRDGLSKSWLCHQQLSVKADSDRHIYHLRYSSEQASYLVLTRLDVADAGPVELDGLVEDFNLSDTTCVLNSQSSESTEGLPKSIAARQCIVLLKRQFRLTAC